MIVDTQGAPGVGHSKYGSILQPPEQPSPGRLLPSSQASGGSRLMEPSPQAGGATSSHSSGAFSASHGLGTSGGSSVMMGTPPAPVAVFPSTLLAPPSLPPPPLLPTRSALVLPPEQAPSVANSVRAQKLKKGFE